MAIASSLLAQEVTPMSGVSKLMAPRGTRHDYRVPRKLYHWPYPKSRSQVIGDSGFGARVSPLNLIVGFGFRVCTCSFQLIERLVI
jgi:hypothetical protein